MTCYTINANPNNWHLTNAGEIQDGQDKIVFRAVQLVRHPAKKVALATVASIIECVLLAESNCEGFPVIFQIHFVKLASVVRKVHCLGHNQMFAVSKRTP